KAQTEKHLAQQFGKISHSHSNLAHDTGEKKVIKMAKVQKSGEFAPKCKFRGRDLTHLRGSGRIQNLKVHSGLLYFSRTRSAIRSLGTGGCDVSAPQDLRRVSLSRLEGTLRFIRKSEWERLRR